MTELELDDWFFNLPASWQMEIVPNCVIDEMTASDLDYEKFDEEVANWWDVLPYEEKLAIYKNETK